MRDVESFKGEVLLATISNKQEQDRILGKVASFRNRAEKLANSKEAKLLKPDGLAENWQKTLSDLWDMCPRAVIAETEDIVHESKRGALISNVREKLMEHIKKIQVLHRNYLNRAVVVKGNVKEVNKKVDIQQLAITSLESRIGALEAISKVSGTLNSEYLTPSFQLALETLSGEKIELSQNSILALSNGLYSSVLNAFKSLVN